MWYRFLTFRWNQFLDQRFKIFLLAEFYAAGCHNCPSDGWDDSANGQRPGPTGSSRLLQSLQPTGTSSPATGQFTSHKAYFNHCSVLVVLHLKILLIDTCKAAYFSCHFLEDNYSTDYCVSLISHRNVGK